MKRIKAHFAGALEMLEANGGAGLSAAQRSARAERIADLRKYALRGQFPKNRDFHDRMMPYFVDAAGTRCAVAHLVEQSGDADLVRKIVRNRNNQLVPELAQEPRLVAWLETQGITLAEATRIQPTYCTTWAEACLCEYYSEQGVIEVEAFEDGAGAIAFRVTAAYDAKYAVGDVADPFYAPSAKVGDKFVGAGYGGGAYRVNDDGTVDMSTCQSVPGGHPPGNLPKETVIANMRGEECGTGLGPEWTQQWGGSGCEEPPPEEEAGGCSAAPSTAPFGGALFFASLLIGGAIRLRTRRVRK